jgi:hypothetical protein
MAFYKPLALTLALVWCLHFIISTNSDVGSEVSLDGTSVPGDPGNRDSNAMDDLHQRVKDIRAVLEMFPSYDSKSRDEDAKESKDVDRISTDDGFLPVTPREGLSDSCSNKLCEMYKSALSCKAFGIDISKICAEYFLGYVLGCPAFPAKNDFFEAPSTCSGELKLLGEILKEGVSFNSSLIENYLGGNFTVNCHRNCYATYLNASEDFYTSCSSSLNTSPLNATYTIAVQLERYREFHEQVCVVNKQNESCFSEIYSMTSAKSPFDVFNMDCNYFNSAEVNKVVLHGVCEKFSPYGCCFGNQVAMLQQNQGDDDRLRVKLFPPCLQRYLQYNCPTLSATDFCTKGSLANVTVVNATVTLGSVEDPLGQGELPNVYDMKSLMQFQSVLIQSLKVGCMDTSEYNMLGFDSERPYQVEVLGYEYFGKRGEHISTADGFPFDLSGGDYTDAAIGKYHVAFVVSGVNDYTSRVLLECIRNTSYTESVGLAYTSQATSISITSNHVYNADPILTYKNSASQKFSIRVVTVLSMLICSFIVILLM